MSFQSIIETAFSQKIITPEMEEHLRSILFSEKFTAQDLINLKSLTEQIESGEITILGI